MRRRRQSSKRANRLFAQVVGASAIFIHLDQKLIRIDANIIAICRRPDFYQTTCWLVPKRIFGVMNACRRIIDIDNANIKTVRNPQLFIWKFENVDHRCPDGCRQCGHKSMKIGPRRGQLVIRIAKRNAKSGLLNETSIVIDA